MLSITIILASLGFLLGVLGLSLSLFAPKGTDGKLNVRQGGLIVKSVFVLATGAGALLGLALVGFILVALWWVIIALSNVFTPATLALFSVALGIFPLVLSALGAGLAHALGGSVDTGQGAKNCHAFGINFGPLVEVLFMSFWLFFLTGGLAMMGLIASAIWAILR